MECAVRLNGGMHGESAAEITHGWRRQSAVMIARAVIYSLIAATAADIPLALLCVPDSVLIAVLISSAAASASLSAAAWSGTLWHIERSSLCVRRTMLRRSEYTLPVTEIAGISARCCPLCALSGTVCVVLRLRAHGARVRLFMRREQLSALRAVLPVVEKRRRVVTRGRSAVLSRGTITVRSGCFITRSESFTCDEVSAVELDRTLIMARRGRATCRMCVCGQKVTVFSTLGERRANMELATLFPREGAFSCACVPERDRALYSACWLIAALFACCACVRYAIYGKTAFAALFAFLCAALLGRAALCTRAAQEASVCVGERWVSVSGVCGIFLRKVRVPRDKIAQVKTVRLPFIGSQPLCAVYIRPVGTRRGIWCGCLPADRTCALLERVR